MQHALWRIVMKKVDLPYGSKFGKLTVLKMEIHKGRRACLCQCSCGNTTHAYPSDLKKGRRKSCGCKHVSVIAGQKYGMLTAIKKHEIKNNRQFWKFRCECGEEVVRSATRVKYNFNNGMGTSCGCLALGRPNLRNRKNYGEAAANKVFGNYKRNASKKDMEFNITKEQALDIMSKNCYYCGMEPSRVMKSKKLYGEFIYNGLDRKDNNEGYTLSNILPCCTYCNFKKSNDDYEEFIEWIDKVHKNIYNK